MLNNILIFVVMLCLIAFVYTVFFRKKRSAPVEDTLQHQYDLKSLKEFAKKSLYDMITADPYQGNPSAEEFRRKRRRIEKLNKALRTCMHGDIPAKKLVKATIKDLLVEVYGLNEGTVNIAIPFDNPKFLSDQECFDILLYLYGKTHKKNAFNRLVDEFKLVIKKQFPDGSKNEAIMGEAIRKAYEKLNPKLVFNDKLEILVQRIYQEYKGLGVIDAIREQKLNGVRAGSSGLPADIAAALDLTEYLDNDIKSPPLSYESVWIFFRGRSVALPFLSFGSQRELIRVVNNAYGHNNPGQLNRERGYILNDMADGSRVVAMRPPFVESYGLIIRLFDDEFVELEKIIRGKNAQFAIDTLRLAVKAKQNMAITGPAGAGKTTTVKAIIGDIHYKTLRFQEDFYEIWARRLFPYKDIFSIRKTPGISRQEGLDAIKKMDAAVTILGEAASHMEVDYAFQLAKSATEFVMFTHHGKTFDNLLDSLRNSLMAAGGYSDERIAMKDVVSGLHFDFHFNIDGSGERYLERVTQVVPKYKKNQIKREYREQKNLMDKLDSALDTIVDMFGQFVNADYYDERNILIYKDGEYCVGEIFTDEKIEELRTNMITEDKQWFEDYLKQYWREVA